MGFAFAVNNGTWSSGSTWAGGIIPIAGDEVYTNNYTVAIDVDIDVDRISSDLTMVGVPGCEIPRMTSNTLPYGTAIASSDSYPAYLAFNKSLSLDFWQSNASNTGWLGFQYPTTKVIKQYSFYAGSSNTRPKDFTFEGSNDGVNWTVLHTVTNNLNQIYYSGIISNTTPYTSYRINVTAVGLLGQLIRISLFDMSESSVAVSLTDVYKNGGGTTITGSRNINFSGEGLMTNTTANLMVINSTSGDTINFTVSGGGYVIGPNQQRGTSDITLLRINNTPTVNFTCDLYGVNLGVHSINNSRPGLLVLAGAPIVNIVGNIYGSFVNNTGNSSPVINSTGANAILNITGNIIGNSQSKTRGGIWVSGLNSITTIIGTLDTTFGNCVWVNGTCTLNHIGVVRQQAQDALPVIISNNDLSSPTIKVTSPIINSNGSSAIQTNKLTFYNTANIQWTVQDDLGVNKILTTAGGSSGVPLESDVRDGVTYGVASSLTGTLSLPSASNVRMGVPFDNTVGTAELTAEDFLNAISGSSNAIAVRLRNVATVDTVGGQISAFIP